MRRVDELTQRQYLGALWDQLSDADKGIGGRLYRKLIDTARRHGITEITALINLDNPSSMKLHHKAGFVLQDRQEAKLKLR